MKTYGWSVDDFRRIFGKNYFKERRKERMRYIDTPQGKDDIETMRILFGAFINKLCNQNRHAEAEEYEQIRDRLIKELKKEGKQ